MICVTYGKHLEKNLPYTREPLLSWFIEWHFKKSRKFNLPYIESPTLIRCIQPHSSSNTSHCDICCPCIASTLHTTCNQCWAGKGD